ncbi:cytochrome P450 [Colletotrichum orchidophilum]|uniref:Cytochrome P450 n=1 Tax=Colletotrichum orchidophilum TaxID=1209926 RepID=A0A1G4BT25_9PEZI|nr:cytochrome P450 [Colletotrichum orchidophilum]OHF04466.1 cytochrome P450 [Colletotrichum orchidophilum]
MDGVFAFVLRSITAAVWVAAVGSVLYFIKLLRKHRGKMAELRKQGLPIVPHSFLFGNLLEAKKSFDSLPPGVHANYVLARLGELFGENGAFYLDTWPMADPMLVVLDPEMAHQTVYHPVTGLQKPPMLVGWFHPITGGPSQFDTNGRLWKDLHALFNPSFSNQNITAAVPIILGNIATFTERLRARVSEAEGEANGRKSGSENGMFRLEPLMLDLITDVIGEVLLNMRLDTQKRQHPLAEAMKGQLRLKFTSHKPENLLAPIDPFLLFRTWNGGRVLDNHIKRQINARFRTLLQNRAHNRDKAERFQSVLDSALESWLAQPGNAGRTELDAEYLAVMTRNMRMFFFAGYDSSAATIVYCLHNIFSRPSILARVRAEHDSVLGTDASAAPARITENPALLNALPLTNACIKESLRLFPPAGGIRQGCADLILKDAAGNAYPTDGIAVNMLHWAIGRNPRYWPRPDEYLPERWLVTDPEHELYPPKGGWRIFEYGPRLCVGQQLVMTEVRAVLACVLREFDIQDCYGEIDAGKKIDLSGLGGQRVFMVEAGAAHPTDGYPCRVSLSGYQKERS